MAWIHIETFYYSFVLPDLQKVKYSNVSVSSTETFIKDYESKSLSLLKVCEFDYACTAVQILRVHFH